MNSFAACNATSDGAGNACGWATGGTTCKAKACTDTITSPSAATCVAYLSSCRFVGSACVVAGACNTYALNSFAACSAMTTDTGVACGWATGGANCTTRSCSDAIPTPSATTCKEYHSCAYDGTSCLAVGDCTDYNLTNFSACNLLSDTAGGTSGVTCGWSTGGTNCSAKACNDPISSPSTANCTNYLSSCRFNGSICVNAGACNTYPFTSFAACSALTTNTGVGCGWVTGGPNCTARACTDPIPSPSAATCTAYLASCSFNGTACVVATACTSFSLTSAAACNATSDGAGNYCGFATGGLACKAKACTDVISSPSAATCTAYLSGCLFNGTSCITPGACDTYIAAGANETEKATYCNILSGAVPSARCTYITGANCSLAVACSSYTITTFTSCVLRRNASGVFCGYTANAGACSDRTCD